MLTLAELLKTDGYSVCVASSNRGILIDKAEHHGLEVINLKVARPILQSFTDLKSNWSKIVYLISICLNWLKTPYHFLKLRHYKHICLNDIRSFYYFLPFLLITNSSLIWYVRIKEENKFLIRFFSKICKRIVFVSTDVMYPFEEAGVEKGKMCVVNTGFPSSNISDTQSGSTLRFVCLGSINSRKNQLETLFLYEEIAKRLDIETSLDIVGDCPPGSSYLAELQDMINSSDFLTNSVRLRDYVPDFSKELSNYEVLLFSSKREGLPRTLIEALQAGLFVVSSKVEGTIDIIENENLGLVYECLDEEFFSTLVEKISDPYYFTETSRKERTGYVNSKFSLTNFKSNFISKALN